MSYMEPIRVVGLTYYLDAEFVEVKRAASSHPPQPWSVTLRHGALNWAKIKPTQLAYTLT